MSASVIYLTFVNQQQNLSEPSDGNKNYKRKAFKEEHRLKQVRRKVK